MPRKPKNKDQASEGEKLYDIYQGSGDRHSGKVSGSAKDLSQAADNISRIFQRSHDKKPRDEKGPEPPDIPRKKIQLKGADLASGELPPPQPPAMPPVQQLTLKLKIDAHVTSDGEEDARLNEAKRRDIRAENAFGKVESDKAADSLASLSMSSRAVAKGKQQRPASPPRQASSQNPGQEDVSAGLHFAAA